MPQTGTRKINRRRLGVILGGSGLIGGAITHYFKKYKSLDTTILAPNSKKLSLRVPDDIRDYFHNNRPDFIINTAIAPLDSDAQLAFETNYLGSVNLAKVALSLEIPYIHVSSAAVLPMGKNLREDEMRPLTAGLSNYRKSKIMAELTLRHMHRTEGLDYTCIRLGVVYGKHDHKIQGFHRLLFSVASQSMPFMLTKRGVCHSYSNTKKLPLFIDYILDRREEFKGQTYHFIDREPVELVRLIQTIKSYLGVSKPRNIYVPYRVASFGKGGIKWLIRRLAAVGVEVRFPAELTFLNNFYQTQTLSSEKLLQSSYGDVVPQVTVYSELPDMIEYYLTRWEHLNLIEGYNKEFFDPKKRAEQFLHSPESLLDSIHSQSFKPAPGFRDLL